MRIKFSKYEGAGNDFIMIWNMDGEIRLSTSQIQHLCDRHFGIGSDGLILIEQSDKADILVNFFNPDASQSFCGNGSRCAYRMALDLGFIGSTAVLEAIDGVHEACVSDGNIQIAMNPVESLKPYGNGFVLNTGSPHYVEVVQNLDHLDLKKEAQSIRYNTDFAKDGINVNFIEKKEEAIGIRTYERGVEDETLACGTGVTAAALAYAKLEDHSRPIEVHAKGGVLKVAFAKSKEGFTNIQLTGPAKKVFDGEIDLI